jgi:hypothetical protein
MNLFQEVQLASEFEPLVKAVLATPEAQELLAKLIEYFNEHPLSASLSQTVEKAVLPEVNVPPAGTSLD